MHVPKKKIGRQNYYLYPISIRKTRKLENSCFDYTEVKKDDNLDSDAIWKANIVMSMR